MSEGTDETEFDNLTVEQKERARRFKEQLSESEQQEAKEHAASAEGFREWLLARFPPAVVQQLMDLGPAMIHYLMFMIR